MAAVLEMFSPRMVHLVRFSAMNLAGIRVYARPVVNCYMRVLGENSKKICHNNSLFYPTGRRCSVLSAYEHCSIDDEYQQYSMYLDRFARPGPVDIRARAVRSHRTLQNLY